MNTPGVSPAAVCFSLAEGDTDSEEDVGVAEELCAVDPSKEVGYCQEEERYLPDWLCRERTPEDEEKDDANDRASLDCISENLTAAAEVSFSPIAAYSHPVFTAQRSKLKRRLR
jgi:hypothetical protein